MHTRSSRRIDAKRLINRRFSDPLVQSDMKLWPSEVIPGAADKQMIVVTYKGEEKQFSAEEISSMVRAYKDEGNRIGLSRYNHQERCSDSPCLLQRLWMLVLLRA